MVLLIVQNIPFTVSKSLVAMAKEKLKLEDLKVQSFLTALEQEQLENVKGGAIIKGRRYTFRSRWTSVDTRVEADNAANNSQGG